MTARRAAALLLALSALPARGAEAQRSWVIERFDARIAVEPGGDLRVEEAITGRFSGSWNGIIRAIPVKYRTAQGLNWSIGLSLESVTGADGAPLRHEVSRERHYVKYRIWIPGAQDATRQVVIRYRVRGGLRFFEEHDELYWNVTGDEWDVPIEAATAVITLPDGVTGVRATAFNGVYGATSRDAQVEVAAPVVRVVMPVPLGFREGLTAVVGWDKGAVAEPTTPERAAGVLRNNWPLVLPIPVFLLAFGAWRRRGKDPEERPVVVGYEPPGGLTPAEVGTLVDHAADIRDITATMVDLAVRGFLRFEEREKNQFFGLVKDREYLLHRVRPRGEWAALPVHERRVLEGLFDGERTPVPMADLEEEFYTSLPGIRDGIFDRLVERGLYAARPDQVRARWAVLAALTVAAIIGLGVLFAARFSLTPVPFVIAGVLSGVILGGFGAVMPARTVRGARAFEAARGFEEFLRRVEKEHFEHVVKTPALFDRFLPYAMALGVEQKWARAFQDIYTEPPTWYVGAGTGMPRFDAGYFSARLGDFTSKAGSTLSSSPRSSSGSGFGGGGSSGGGGGGGGGSGF